MTENEWLTSDDPAAMRLWLGGPNDAGVMGRASDGSEYACTASNRKLCLFSYAVYRTIKPHDDDQERMATEWENQESSINPYPLLAHWSYKYGREFAGILRDIFGNPWKPLPVIRRIARGASEMSVRALELGVLEELLWEEEWLTPTVLSVAQCIYDDRDFSGMPILADALEEAGCAGTECRRCLGTGKRVFCRQCRATYHYNESEICQMCSRNVGESVPADVQTCLACNGTGYFQCPIIAHLRGTGPHVRGCHVLDAILGKS